MKVMIAVSVLLAATALAVGCGDDDDGGLPCVGRGVCMTAEECSEVAHTPVNPSNNDYDCPEDQICCVIIGDGDTVEGAETDAGQDGGE